LYEFSCFDSTVAQFLTGGFERLQLSMFPSVQSIAFS